MPDSPSLPGVNFSRRGFATKCSIANRVKRLHLDYTIRNPPGLTFSRHHCRPATSQFLQSAAVRRKQCHSRTAFVTSVFMLAWVIGCSAESDIVPEKKPIPVEVQVLEKSNLDTKSFVTAPVASWKTEQIGMEVNGRIEWVVEPNSIIEGRVRDAEGNLIIEGTPIARIDKERYELQVQSAVAQVARAEQAIEASRIQIEDTLPAQVRAAEADMKRTKTDLGRSQRLVDQNAGSQADVDRDEAAYRSAASQVKQIEANINAQKAEREALKAQLLQAKDSLREAERSLEDCTLYSSFRGQIAEVAVVPGSVVSAGQAVATIQMMDPIKVEVEVSAEVSRRLRNRQRLAVLVNREDGSVQEKDGYLYLVDTSADPQKRTFTLTLLLMNQRLTDELPSKLPTIDQTWRVDFQFLPGADQGKLYVTHDAIHEDDNGPFVYRVDNLVQHAQLPADRMLKVSKVPIEFGKASIPFLGNWIFKEIRVLDDSFVPSEHLIAGKMEFPDSSDEAWDGETVFFQNDGQWLLRPGDLVKVDLSSSQEASSIYVPMDAIAYEEQRTFVFLIDESSADGEFAKVERVEVEVLSETSGVTSTMLAIKPVETSVELEGRRFVSKGAHYLRDGETTRPIAARASQ